MKSVLTICGLIISLQLLVAQDVKFTVEISSDTLLVGNYFELKYTIENAPVDEFEPPKLKILHVVGGPNTSTRMSFVNGETSQSTSYTYFIEPPEIGNYTIPPAYLTSGTSSLEAPPLDIIVLPNPKGIVQPPNQMGKKYDQIDMAPKTPKKPKRPVKKF
jgi:hypothetical protein